MKSKNLNFCSHLSVIADTFSAWLIDGSPILKFIFRFQSLYYVFELLKIFEIYDVT